MAAKALKQFTSMLKPPPLLRQGRGGLDPGAKVVLYAAGDAAQEASGAAKLQAFLVGSGVSTQVLPFSGHDHASGGGDKSVRAMVIDAQRLRGVGDLNLLHAAGSASTSLLGPGGRLVVLGSCADASASAISSKDLSEEVVNNAAEGFVRSMAKEIGAKGATANLIVTEADSGAWMPSARFLFSGASAFVTGQRLNVNAAAAASGGAESTSAASGDLLGLRGEVCVVTGGAQGIGLATCQALSAAGALVLVVDHPSNASRLEAVAAQLGVGRAACLALDVCDLSAAARVAEAAAALGGGGFSGVRALVHCAGITRDGTLRRMKLENWEAALSVNLGAVADLDDGLAALGGVGLHAGSRSVVLSSIAGIGGNFGQTNYSAAKAGLLGYCSARAKSAGPGGRAWNAIAPGFIETPMTKDMPFTHRFVASKILTPLKHTGLPEDVAAAAAFLASPAAAGLNGVCLRVCGGLALGR